MSRALILLAATAGLLAGPPAARAAFVADSLVTIAGTPATSGPGYFTGSVAVDNISKTSASIQITLTNTSPVANGGYLTGFAFNLPGQIASSTLTQAAPATFTQIGGGTYNNSITNYDAVSGSPYGAFDIGAAVGGSLLGSGSPTSGLAVGQTGTFTFAVTSVTGGYNLNQLTAQVLMSTLSANPQGGGAQPFLARFRGFTNGDSDKVVGGVQSSPPPPPPGAVPAPPAVVLMGIGAALLGARRLRRRAG